MEKPFSDARRPEQHSESWTWRANRAVLLAIAAIQPGESERLPRLWKLDAYISRRFDREVN